MMVTLLTDEERFDDLSWKLLKLLRENPMILPSNGNNPNDIAVHGKVIFRRNKSQDLLWGDQEHYVSEVVENPTWFIVTLFANDMILRTRDYHHIYLEAISYVGDSQVDSDVKIYTFVLGS